MQDIKKLVYIQYKPYLTAAAMFEDQSDAAPADSALKKYMF
jgi:hypothetical protein